MSVPLGTCSRQVFSYLSYRGIVLPPKKLLALKDITKNKDLQSPERFSGYYDWNVEISGEYDSPQLFTTQLYLPKFASNSKPTNFISYFNTFSIQLFIADGEWQPAGSRKASTFIVIIIINTVKILINLSLRQVFQMYTSILICPHTFQQNLTVQRVSPDLEIDSVQSVAVNVSFHVFFPF